MARTLITGMSGTGKSSTIQRLVALGHHAVDLDADEWSHLVPDDSDFADGPLDWRWWTSGSAKARAYPQGRWPAR